MSDKLQSIDTQAFMERVAGEVAKRFSRNLPVAGPKGQIGPPFCAVCSEVGMCAKNCADHVASVRTEGVDRLGGAPGIGNLDRQIACLLYTSDAADE